MSVRLKGTSSILLGKYIDNVTSMNKETASTYKSQLYSFSDFADNIYGKSLDQIVQEIANGALNIYEVLSGYTAYLQNSTYYSTPITTRTVRQRVKVAKNFLESQDGIEISSSKFQLKVKLPRVINRSKEALDKDEIREIILACSDIKLRTYVMFLACTGMRATEALSIRLKDIDLNTDPVKVFIRGEYTKTKQDRFVFLTKEATNLLKSWLEYKYRNHRSSYKNKDGISVYEYIRPIRKSEDLIFAIYHNHKQARPKPENMYFDFSLQFANTLDRIGYGEREDNNKRHKITFHSFRRWVKSTISDLGYADYSEWFIGHSGSTYWRKKESEKAELFRKIEPYLTFLDYSRLETKGADIETKVEELETINQRLRERDTMNTDAIATLSDQLTKVMQEIEILKKQQR